MFKMLKRGLLSLLLSALCLAGCARQTGISSSSETPEQEDLRGTYRIEELNLPDPDMEMSTLKLKQDGLDVFSFSIQLTDTGALWREVYALEPQDDMGIRKAREQFIQRLEAPYDGWALAEYSYLYRDGDDEYTVRTRFFHQGMTAFAEAWRIGDKKNCLAACDGKGNVTEILGEFPEPIQSEFNEYTLFADGAGNIYAYKKEGNQIFSLDREMTITGETAAPDKWRITGMLADASEGKVYWYGHDGVKAGVFDLAGEASAEAEASVYGLYSFMDMDSDGRIYLASVRGLWRLEEGNWMLLCNLPLRDYPLTELHDMKVQGDGSILLYGKLDGEACLLRLLEGKGEEVQEKQEIVLALWDNYRTAMLRSVSRFNRQSDRYHVTVAAPGDDVGVFGYGNWLQMEISAGRGPDIMAGGFGADVSGYCENGYLASLEGLIEDESQYLPAAFEGGRINGVLYGIPYDFSMSLAVYSEDLTEGRTSWTLPELMEAVEKSGASILEYGCSGYDIVLKYGLYDNENTAYIDWERGESHLTEEPFLELLEFARKYQDTVGKNRAETEAEMLQSGQAAATYSYIVDFKELHALEAAFEGKAALLGYPRQSGNGIYAEINYLYVSNVSGGQEGAKEFLKFLLSENEQSRYMIRMWVSDSAMSYQAQAYLPVNLNAFRKLVDYRSVLDMSTTHVMGDRRGAKGYDLSGLTEKQIRQIDFLLENVQPDNWHVREIQSFFWEELAPYFAGDRTAQEVAKTLDGRVQNYLDEKK